MTDRIRRQLAFIEARQHRAYRRQLTEGEIAAITQRICDRGLSYMERATLATELFLAYEAPVMLADTRIPCLRTLACFPEIYAEGEMEEIKRTHYVHEKGKVTNLVWSIEDVLREGLEGRRARLEAGAKKDTAFVSCVNRVIDAVLAYTDRYGDESLSRIARYGASTMEDAFRLFRILHFTLWGTGCYHNTVGRFDQWVYPFYVSDKRNGLTDGEALEQIEDFFLSFNRDSDLYYSLAWGDNGQSLVLGGMLPDGSCGVNEVTYLALTASKELRQIDPKINLRVDKNTPRELYLAGTELTRVGLGFPQYSNDDIVIPCLEHWGYSREDARNYAIAACWEFIIPERALDIPNIGGVPIAEVVRSVIREKLEKCGDTEELWSYIREALFAKCREMTVAVGNLFMEPAPFMSLLTNDCLDRGYDISEGMTYNNYGFHGTGFSCGADQIAAVDSLLFREKRFSAQRLLAGLENNFEEDTELRYLLRNEADKMGRDANANETGNRLLGLFADALQGIRNERGGVFRAGTGSAMYYVWHSERLGATADGREAYDYFPANFSPSLFLTNAGPLSVLLGFTPNNLLRTANGGPMTLELHETVFKTAESTAKVADLVRVYILNGGHQLQLNAVDKEKLKAAQLRPEQYGELIVRVWGWSGHFVELPRCYQDQIIRRAEYGL